MLQLRNSHVFALERRTRQPPWRFTPVTHLFLREEFFVGDSSLWIDVRNLAVVKDPDLARTVVGGILPVYLRLNHSITILLNHLHIPQLLVFGIEKLDKPYTMILAIWENVSVQARALGLAFNDFVEHVCACPLSLRPELIVQNRAGSGQQQPKKDQRKQHPRNTHTSTQHRHDLVAPGHAREHVQKAEHHAYGQPADNHKRDLAQINL